MRNNLSTFYKGWLNGLSNNLQNFLYYSAIFLVVAHTMTGQFRALEMIFFVTWSGFFHSRTDGGCFPLVNQDINWQAELKLSSSRFHKLITIILPRQDRSTIRTLETIIGTFTIVLHLNISKLGSLKFHASISITHSLARSRCCRKCFLPEDFLFHSWPEILATANISYNNYKDL